MQYIALLQFLENPSWLSMLAQPVIWTDAHDKCLVLMFNRTP